MEIDKWERRNILPARANWLLFDMTIAISLMMAGLACLIQWVRYG